MIQYWRKYVDDSLLTDLLAQRKRGRGREKGRK